jgi:hypothetical protein
MHVMIGRCGAIDLRACWATGPARQDGAVTDGDAGDATGQLSDAVALWRVGAAPASDVVDAAVECLVADVDSPALRELAGESPRESRFILDPLIDQALDELCVDRLVLANPQRAALTAVLKRYKRGELTAAAAAKWAHRYIGHLGDARCQVFVDFDDMYDTVNYASYTAADLDKWMAEESDAFLAGRASPGRTRIWRSP